MAYGKKNARRAKVGLAPILGIWSEQITSYLRLNERLRQTLACNPEIE